MSAVFQIVRERSRALIVEQVRSSEGLEAIREPWLALRERVRDAHPSTTPHWVDAWRDYQANPSRRHRPSLDVYTVHSDDGLLRAVIPITTTDVRYWGMTLHRSVAVGIASFCVEPSHLLVMPEDEAAVVDAVEDHLVTLNADRVTWRGLLPDGDSIHRLRSQRGADREQPFTTASVRLPESWEALGRGLSRKFRKTLRRNRRSVLERGGGYELRVSATPATLAHSLDVFESLHGLGNDGTLTPLGKQLKQDGAREFLRSITLHAGRNAVARIFELVVDGRPVAVRIGFVANNVLYLHLFADDAGWKKDGVLTLLTAEILRHAIASGLRAVYLCTGRQRSNMRWMPDVASHGVVTVWAPTPRAQAIRVLRHLKRAVAPALAWTERSKRFVLRVLTS